MKPRMPWWPTCSVWRFDGSQFSPRLKHSDPAHTERWFEEILNRTSATETAYARNASRQDDYDETQHANDYRDAINVLGYFSDADVLEVHLRYMEVRARALVASEWWLIEAIADALVARTTLTGRKFRRLIGDAYMARLQKDQTGRGEINP
jgi:hypothetical protein